LDNKSSDTISFLPLVSHAIRSFKAWISAPALENLKMLIGLDGAHGF